MIHNFLLFFCIIIICLKSVLVFTNLKWIINICQFSSKNSKFIFSPKVVLSPAFSLRVITGMSEKIMTNQITRFLNKFKIVCFHWSLFFWHHRYDAEWEGRRKDNLISNKKIPKMNFQPIFFSPPTIKKLPAKVPVVHSRFPPVYSRSHFHQ